MSKPVRQFNGRRTHPRVAAAIRIEVVPDRSSEIIRGVTLNLAGRKGVRLGSPVRRCTGA